MSVRLHRNGRTRRWLGERLGGDVELGDRVWRRVLHVIGAAVLVYFLLPPHAFIVAPNEVVLLLALALVLVLEALRHLAGWELPTIRPHERERIASFAWYAMALTAAVLVFPEPVAMVVVLGTAIVDPIAGEVRLLHRRALYPALPLIAYAAIAAVSLAGFFGWTLAGALVAATLAATVGVASEFPKHPLVDDDLAMTLVPGIALALTLALWPTLTTL
ncbi:MAG: hypothetical protein ACREDK_01055 [Thermoplasmata archaeon]